MSNDEERELVMPFVVVKSADGPYDDDAYTAGWEAGAIDTELGMFSQAVVSTSWMVRADNVPQFDLIAMRYGWTMTVEEPIDGETWADWKRVTFKRDDGPEEDDEPGDD